MRNKAFRHNLLYVVIVVVGLLIFGFKGNDSQNSLNKPTSNDNYNFIAINQVLMYVSNNGDGSHDPGTDGSGFYWPGGENAVQAAIFEDGLVWGGRIGREIRFNGNTHRQGLQAGKILPDGTADESGLSKYRVYKIRKGWELLPPGPTKDDYERDYNNWPVEDGAPWVDENGDGVFTRGVDTPKFDGDEVLWYVANDLDEERSLFTYGSPSIGLEFQTTVFGFNRTGDLGDIVFKKYLMINKSQNTINDMIIGYWSDTDLGDASDDCSGCDTVLSLGYTYNGDNMDGTGAGIHYGANPPAVGYDFFQGPVVPASPSDSAKFLGKWKKGYKNLGLTAYTMYINGFAEYKDPDQGEYAGTIQFYNYLSGLIWDGTPFINPHTGETAQFVVAGDPTQGTAGGWHYLNWPGGPTPRDVRHVMASGPFTLAPGDSQEVVVGIIIARGTDNLNSITELKRKDLAAQISYDLDFNLTPAPPAPSLHVSPKDQEITIWWETNAETYYEQDPLIVGQVPDDSTFYNFEGYRVWEFADQTGADPQLLAIYDIANGIDKIEGNAVINGENVIVTLIKSPDEGLRRHLTLTTSKITGTRFRNANPYYFGVTAYGYSKHSDPAYLESPPVILEVLPETKKIDNKYVYNNDDFVVAQQVSGVGHGRVEFKVLEANYLTGDDYKVVINGAADSISLDLINVTVDDTLLAGFTEFDENYYFSTNLVEAGLITDETFVYENLAFSADGFLFLVQNQGKDSIDLALGSQNYVLKDVLEVKGPGGTELAEPINVIKNMNSTEKWRISSHGAETDDRVNMDWQDAIGFDNYEIRFTAGGSEYYASGRAFSFTPPTRNDPKGEGKVPFEIWNVGLDLTSAADDYRLIIKVLDLDKPDTLVSIPDTSWSQLPNGDWEEIYCYWDDRLFPIDSTYSEPLPAFSGNSARPSHFIGKVVIQGELPEEGTVIRFVPWRPLKEGDVYTITMTQPDKSSLTTAKSEIDKISVFPNPYFGSNALERDKYQRFMRFTNLPTNVKVRIFTIAGVLVTTLEKNDETSQWLDWDVRNQQGIPVASGIYIAYLEMPGIGEKIMKIAVIMETQFIDRL